MGGVPPSKTLMGCHRGGMTPDDTPMTPDDTSMTPHEEFMMEVPPPHQCLMGGGPAPSVSGCHRGLIWGHWGMFGGVKKKIGSFKKNQKNQKSGALAPDF